MGVGGFGEVWRARNPHLASAEPVALKFCLDPGAAKVLRHEAAVLDRVMRHGKHPGIVQLRHTYLSAEPPCLEYELVSGGDLGGLIQEWHKAKKGPSAAEAARVMLRLAEIVGFAHSQSPPIVHRDLKPANLLVQKGTGGKIKLRVADFGIGGVAASQAVEMTRRATAGALLTTMLRGSCTPLYASPQQARGDAPDPRDDVYALGVIWYQMLTGDLTQGAPSGMQWAKQLTGRGVPEAHVQLLASCIEPRAEDRPATAVVLAAQLTAFSAPQPVPPTATPVGARLPVPPAATGPSHGAAALSATGGTYPPPAAWGHGGVGGDVSGRMRQVKLLDDLRHLQAALGAVRKGKRLWVVNLVGVVLGCLLALGVGGGTGALVNNAERLRRDYEQLHPPPALPSQYDPQYRDANGFTDHRRLDADQRAYYRYGEERQQYVRANENLAACVVVGLLVGALALPAPWLLLRWRKHRQLRSAVALQEEWVQQIARDYPDWVRHWGGEQLLGNPAVVKAILSGLGRAVPG
jgi:serine/threonine protein kinase